MSTEVRRQIGLFLIEGLPDVDEDARLLRSARDWAIHYEQAATEYGRRVSVALLIVDEMDCRCGSVHGCAKHQLDSALRGDR